MVAAATAAAFPHHTLPPTASLSHSRSRCVFYSSPDSSTSHDRSCMNSLIWLSDQSPRSSSSSIPARARSRGRGTIRGGSLKLRQTTWSSITSGRVRDHPTNEDIFQFDVLWRYALTIMQTWALVYMTHPYFPANLSDDRLVAEKKLVRRASLLLFLAALCAGSLVALIVIRMHLPLQTCVDIFPCYFSRVAQGDRIATDFRDVRFSTNIYIHAFRIQKRSRYSFTYASNFFAIDDF